MRQSEEGGVPPDLIVPGRALGPRVRVRLAGFAQVLRDNGFKIGLAETGDALMILSSPAAARSSLLKPALRSLFCATHSDWERFDTIFDAYWLRHGMRGKQVLSGATTPSKSPPRRLGDAGRSTLQADSLADHVELRKGPE